jgi:hypothetical protein
VASCRRLGKLDLVLLDPLRDLHSGEEDKSDDMREVMRRLRLVGELVGCTVAVVHHAAKATKDTKSRRPGQRLRGSGAIHGAVDCGIYLGDLDGDGASTFRNSVDVEIKGARGAGHFDLSLAIVDDAMGEATRATWTLDRESPDAVARGDAGDVQSQTDVAAFLRVLAIEHAARRTYTRRQWRNAEMRSLVLDARGETIPEKRMVAAFARALHEERATTTDRDPSGYSLKYPHVVPATPRAATVTPSVRVA